MEKYFNSKAKANVRTTETHRAYDLLTPDHGCTAGCKAGIGEHLGLDFPPTQTHETQEGFYVVSGKGWAILDGKEHRMEPGTALIVPPGVAHALKRDADVPCLEVFFFHAAAK